MFAGDPNWKLDVWQNINNIFLFIPFGLLFPSNRFRIVCFSAMVFSIAIEVAQYLFMLGLAEIDDVICNTLGAAVGFGMIRVVGFVLRGSVDENRP